MLCSVAGQPLCPTGGRECEDGGGMTHNHAGGLGSCLESDLSPADRLARLAGDLIEACVRCPTQPCPGRSTTSTRRRLGHGLDGGNRRRHAQGRARRRRPRRDWRAARQPGDPDDPAGYRRLLSGAQELGVPAFAIEGTGSYGAGLVRFLKRANVGVEVPDRQSRRSPIRRPQRPEGRDERAAPDARGPLSICGFSGVSGSRSDPNLTQPRNEGPKGASLFAQMAYLSHGRYWARTSDPQLVELVLSQLS
jgi:hypothetical protein